MPEGDVAKLLEQVMTDFFSQTWWQLSAHRFKKLNEPRYKEHTNAYHNKIIYHQR